MDTEEFYEDMKENILGIFLRAKEQQASTDQTIAAIQLFLVQIEKQSTRLDSVSKSISSSSEKVIDAFNKSLPGFKTKIKESNDYAIENSLSLIKTQSKEILEESLDPIIKSLSETAYKLRVARDNIDNTTNKMTWVFLIKNIVGLGSLIALSFFIVFWEGEKYQKLVAENEKLSRDIKSLSDKGARLNIQNCDGRFCVEVHKNSVKFTSGSQTYIIPKGY